MGGIEEGIKGREESKIIDFKIEDIALLCWGLPGLGDEGLLGVRGLSLGLAGVEGLGTQLAEETVVVGFLSVRNRYLLGLEGVFEDLRRGSKRKGICLYFSLVLSTNLLIILFIAGEGINELKGYNFARLLSQ